MEFVRCNLCGGTLIYHNYSHIKKHGVSVEYYLAAHPDLRVENLDKISFGDERHSSDSNLSSKLSTKKFRKRFLSEITRIKDVEKRRRAFVMNGYTDSEIAYYEGLSRKGIASYRVRVLNLPPNKVEKGEK